MIVVKENTSLAEYTTFEIGGCAKYFVEASSVDDIKEAIAFAKEHNIKYFVFSGGSNVLFSDNGFDGLVIRIANMSMTINGGELMCAAGTRLMDFLVFAAENELTGGENLTGIPGSVGGAVRGNAGAFGTEMQNVVKEVYAFNTQTEEVEIFDKERCVFSYRNSFFKKNAHYIIVSVTCVFLPGVKKEIQVAMYDTIAKRNNLQIQDVKSAGSWFINPEVNERVQEMFEHDTGKKPHEGRVPAGWLLQSCGLFKKRIGDIQAGIQHANYFINMGEGTAEQAMQLSTVAKTRVRDEYEINLKEEVVLAGF